MMYFHSTRQKPASQDIQSYFIVSFLVTELEFSFHDKANVEDFYRFCIILFPYRK
jgi:hypothetical protein